MRSLQIARSFTSILRTVEGKSVRQFCETLTSLDHPYWRWHASVAREALPKATALIGDDRARDLAINVLLPALSYEEAHREMAASVGPTPNRKILQAVEWLGEGPSRLCFVLPGISRDYCNCMPISFPGIRRKSGRILRRASQPKRVRARRNPLSCMSAGSRICLTDEV